MTITRRECLRYLSAGTGAVFAGSAVDAFAQTSPYKGVVLGVQSYSFRDRGLDEAIAAMKQVGLNSCELWQGHLEPKKVTREVMRKWRETTPLSEFQSVRDRSSRRPALGSTLTTSASRTISVTPKSSGGLKPPRRWAPASSRHPRIPKSWNGSSRCRPPSHRGGHAQPFAVRTE